jgi:predicted AAA+ superfamily ATPase
MIIIIGYLRIRFYRAVPPGKGLPEAGTISPFERSRKRIVTAPRFLLFDLGVRHILAELPLNYTLLMLDPGHIFEQWVLIELYYRCRYITWEPDTG